MINSRGHLCHLVSQGFMDWRSEGMVKVTSWEGLLQFSYTQECNSKPPSEWNLFEQISRGLILEERTGRIVALPFDKFWNWGQVPVESYPIIEEVTEKMDGSLGILFWHKGKPRIATRGSFESDQALWATEWLNTHTNMAGFDPKVTLLFEIIYPENRVVVDYGDRRGLTLIGARTIWGDDWRVSGLGHIASSYGFDLPRVYDFSMIEDILKRAKELDGNEEGFVVRLQDGSRYKIKGDAYLELHRFVSHFSFKRVAEAFRDGQLGELRGVCPENYKGLLAQFESDIADKCADLSERVLKASDACNLAAEAYVHGTSEYNKAYALFVQEHYKDLSRFLFKARDGKNWRGDMFSHLFDI
jgi:RNA ligase